jgi:hypothetical protein
MNKIDLDDLFKQMIANKINSFHMLRVMLAIYNSKTGSMRVQALSERIGVTGSSIHNMAREHRDILTSFDDFTSDGIKATMGSNTRKAIKLTDLGKQLIELFIGY